MIENIPGEKPLEIILNEHKNKCLVLHGPPGIGKTSIAIEYCHKLINQEHWNVQWLSAETSQKFENIELIIKLQNH